MRRRNPLSRQPREPLPLLPCRVLAAGSGAGKQVDVFLIELLLIEVVLDVDENLAHAGLETRRPRQRVAVAGTVVNVDIDVELLPLGDDAGVEPCDGSKFVPEIAGHGVFGYILSGRLRAFA